MKYSWKGHKDRNRHKNRIKRSEASSVGLCQKCKPQHPHHVKMNPLWRTIKRQRRDKQIKLRPSHLQIVSFTRSTRKHYTMIHMRTARTWRVLMIPSVSLMFDNLPLSMPSHDQPTALHDHDVGTRCSCWAILPPSNSPQKASACYKYLEQIECSTRVDGLSLLTRKPAAGRHCALYTWVFRV